MYKFVHIKGISSRVKKIENELCVLCITNKKVRKVISATKESVEEQEIAGNRDSDSKDRSRKTTEMVIKREQKR